MLTRVRDMPQALDGPQRPFAALAAGAFLALSVLAALSSDWPGETDKITVVPFREMGEALFRDWAVPFEVASLVLLVALIGYMKDDPRYGWYFAAISMFAAAMLALVLADNFLLLYGAGGVPFPLGRGGPVHGVSGGGPGRR